jgi:hypothetical protein
LSSRAFLASHEGEVWETVVSAKREKAAAQKYLKRIMKKWPIAERRDRWALLLSRGVEQDPQY